MDEQKNFVSKSEFYLTVFGIFMLMSCILGFVESRLTPSVDAIFNTRIILIVLAVVFLGRAIIKK